MKVLSLFSMIFVFSLASFGYEVDQFTRRDKTPKDSTAILDAEIQRRLAEALKTANSSSYKCNGDSKAKDESRINLFNALRRQFESITPVGTLEKFVTKNPKISKRHLELSESIYSQEKKHSPILKKAGVTDVITVNGVQIGADKLGHFFDEGNTVYTQNFKNSYEEQKYRFGLFHSIDDENRDHGILTTGVFSYADIAANYGGHRFWEKICGYPNKNTDKADLENFKQFRCFKNSYVFCSPETGDWTLNPNQKFTLKDYVTPAWDESINCSLYDSDVAESVYKQMNNRAHLYKGNPIQPCPAEPKKCLQFQRSYTSDVADKLTSPLCKKIIEATKSQKPIDKKEKFSYDVEYYKELEQQKQREEELRKKGVAPRRSVS